jgi:alanyl-tRNA synthetase
MIQRNIPRGEERGVPIQQALSKGATALFGEKYGESVRVISFDPDYSIELCGGTHVGATGEIGLFRFLTESSVAAGVRRVEAVAGAAAVEYVDRRLVELHHVESQFKALQRPVATEVSDVLEQRRMLSKELESVKVKLHSLALAELMSDVRQIGSVRVLSHRIDPCDMDTLRQLGQELRSKLGSGSVGVLGAVDPSGDKAYLVTTVSDDLIKEGRLSAGTIVSALAKTISGGGGGRPELATAGGKNPDRLDEAIEQIYELVTA